MLIVWELHWIADFLHSPVEILASLKKFREIHNSLFCAEFYEEFNGGSCQIFPLGQKKVWAKM